MYLINLYLYLFVYQLCLYFLMFILSCFLVNGTFCNEKWHILYPVVSFLPVNGSDGIWKWMNEWMNEWMKQEVKYRFSVVNHPALLHGTRKLTNESCTFFSKIY
jgi:hypothetical protein